MKLDNMNCIVKLATDGTAFLIYEDKEGEKIIQLETQLVFKLFQLRIEVNQLNVLKTE